MEGPRSPRRSVTPQVSSHPNDSVGSEPQPGVSAAGGGVTLAEGFTAALERKASISVSIGSPRSPRASEPCRSPRVSPPPLDIPQSRASRDVSPCTSPSQLHLSPTASLSARARVPGSEAPLVAPVPRPSWTIATDGMGMDLRRASGAARLSVTPGTPSSPLSQSGDCANRVYLSEGQEARTPGRASLESGSLTPGSRSRSSSHPANRRPFSPGPMPKPTADATWCSIRRNHVREIMQEHAPSEHDAHRFLACLRTIGYDNIYALKAVAKDPDELENLGIDQVVPRRRICKTLQHTPLPPFPPCTLTLERYLFALLEYEAPEDSAFRNCLTTLRDEGGFFTVEDLHLAPDDQIRALPLLEGHKLALLAAKQGDTLSRSNSDTTQAAGLVGEGKLEDELFGSEKWEGERSTSR